MMRLLGIDYGRMRIGVALGDTDTRIASALDIFEVKNNKEGIERIRELAHLEGIRQMVIGIPTSLRERTETAQTEEVRGFAAGLREAGFEVIEEDETLSSVLASRQMKEAGSGKKRIDDLAAAAILQSYLDQLPSNK